MTTATYAIPLYTFGILADAPRDREEFYDLKYHLKTGDYFGVLASIMGLCIDAEERTSAKSDEGYYRLKLLHKTRRDLGGLNTTHDIVPKKEKRSR